MAANNDPHQDSRADERVDLQAEVDLEFESFQGFLSEFASNLSIGGMFVRSDQPAPTGTRLDFVLKLKDDFKLVYGKGQVMWARAQTLGPDQPAGMGVRFLELRGESLDLIQRIVDQHMATGGSAFDLEAAAPADGHVERPDPPTVKTPAPAVGAPFSDPSASVVGAAAPSAASAPPAPVVDFATDPDAGRVVDSAAAAVAERERQERERIEREQAQGPIDPDALADFLGPADRLAEQRHEAAGSAPSGSGADALDGSGSFDGLATPWPDSLQVPGFSTDDLDDTDLTGNVFVPPPAAAPTLGSAATDVLNLPDLDASGSLSAPSGAVPVGVAPSGPSVDDVGSSLDDTVVVSRSTPKVAAVESGVTTAPVAEQPPPPQAKRPRRLSLTTVLLVLASAGIGALLSSYSEPLVAWISGYDNLRDNGEIVDVPPPATLRAESAEAQAASAPSAARGSDADASSPTSGDGVAAVDGAASPASLSVARDPMTQVRLITWKQEQSATVITLWGDGYLGEESLTQVRLEGENARQVFKLRGINWPYREPVLYVNSEEVERVRVGFHPKPAGNELHIVLDLASAGVQLTAVDREANKLQLRFAS